MEKISYSRYRFLTDAGSAGGSLPYLVVTQDCRVGEKYGFTMLKDNAGNIYRAVFTPAGITLEHIKKQVNKNQADLFA